jgi:DNA-binding response OmpR family regulator
VVIRCRTPHVSFEALEKAGLILLNLQLPDVDGLSLLTELRLASSAPILVYSTRSEVDSVVAALERGADDYMVEPIRPLELLARMKAISRRAGACCPTEQVIKVGDIKICLRGRTVEVGGEPVRLTSREFELLLILARKAGSSVSREDIMSEVWGRAGVAISRNLDVYMSALRTKLSRPNLLRTVRGFGYRLGQGDGKVYDLDVESDADMRMSGA